MKTCYQWLAALKAFAIVIVILGHMDSPYNHFIFSWHMPFFFMLSGFFIKINMNFGAVIIKDYSRLLVPYFLFAVFAVSVETLKRMLLHRSELDLLQEFWSVFYWMDMSHLKTSYAFVLWFLPALFFSRQIAFLILKYVKNIFIQFGIAQYFFIISFKSHLPFGLSNAFNAVLWLMLGYYIFTSGILDKLLFFSKINKIITCICLFGILIFIIYYEGIPSLNMSMLDYGSIMTLFIWNIDILILLCLLFIVFDIYKKFNSNVVLWGSSTLFIFALHPYTNNISYIILQKFNMTSWLLELMLSLFLLQLLLKTKHRYSNNWFLKYV